LSDNWSLKTECLSIRFALPESATIDFLYRLWTNPEIMKFVGFPKGLKITKDEIIAQLQNKYPDEYNRCLIAYIKDFDTAIGECKLGSPDSNGIANTDIKLSPDFQGKGFGTEIKRALVEYLFTNTKCKAVQGTPNKDNIASIKMQEAVGGKRVKEGCYQFPENMREYTTDVTYYEYLVFRSDWNASKK